jgi:hypothetical protein
MSESSFPMARIVALFAVLIPAGDLSAQVVIGTTRSPVWSPANSTAVAATGVVGTLMGPLVSGMPLWQRGGVVFRPHVTYDVMHGTGILRSPGTASEEMTVYSFSPGVLFDLGKHANLDYTLTRTEYSSSRLSDSTDHQVSVNGHASFDKLKVEASGRYGSNTTVLVETGGQTKDETYSTGVTFTYEVARRSELEVGLSGVMRSASPVEETTAWQGADWTLWNVSTWYRQHISPRLDVAAGVAGGYDRIENNPDMTHVRPQIQAKWNPTKKITLEAEYGVERRKTRAGRPSVQENDRYQGTLSYQPFEVTSISATAGRSIEPSYFSDEVVLSDNVYLNFQQRLLQKFFLTVAASERKSDYQMVSDFGIFTRSDRYRSFGVRLSTRILLRGTIAGYYNHGENRSNLSLFNFTTNQFGGSFDYRF